MAKRKPFTVSSQGVISTQAGPFTVSGDPLAARAGASTSTTQGPNTYGISASISPRGYSIGPRAQFGQSAGSAVGAQVGGMAGAAAGGAIGTIIAPGVGTTAGAAAGNLVGSAGGSLIGGGIQKKNPWAGAAAGMPFGPGGMVVGAALSSKFGDKLFGGKKAGQRSARGALAARFQQLGILDENGTMVLPDGTKATLGLEGKEGAHSWKDPSRRVDKEGNRQLFSYDTDYTNDMDFLSGMFGNTLSRMLHGGSNKAIDQTGSALGNQFLGSVGYGADMSSDNFNTVVNNARSVYSRAGIQSKEDALALANQMHADGRINDTDYVAMQQSTNILFNNDYGTAQALMGGRWAGIETANKTPSQGGQMKQPPAQEGQSAQQAQGQPRHRGNHVRVITPAEALAYVQPFVEAARGGVNMGNEGKPNAFMQTAASGLGILRLLGQGRGTLGTLWDRYREWTMTGKNPLDPQSPMLPGGGGNVMPEYGPFGPGGGGSVAPELNPNPIEEPIIGEGPEITDTTPPPDFSSGSSDYNLDTNLDFSQEYY